MRAPGKLKLIREHNTILEKGEGVAWTGFGPVESSFEHDNKPSDYVNCWEILEWLSYWCLLKKDSAPWS
jgi:hypothetical protein